MVYDGLRSRLITAAIVSLLLPEMYDTDEG